jgi:hypothetical protein
LKTHINLHVFSAQLGFGVGVSQSIKTQYLASIRVRLIPRTKKRLIAKHLGIFGPNLAPRDMFFCWKFPLHDVDDDARMLGIQGEVWRCIIEATMEDWIA